MGVGSSEPFREEKNVTLVPRIETQFDCHLAFKLMTSQTALFYSTSSESEEERGNWNVGRNFL